MHEMSVGGGARIVALFGVFGCGGRATEAERLGEAEEVRGAGELCQAGRSTRVPLQLRCEFLLFFNVAYTFSLNPLISYTASAC